MELNFSNFSLLQIHRVRGVGDDQHALRRKEWLQTLHRNLKHGTLAQQFERLLGLALARERPQARAAAACHDDCVEVFHVLALINGLNRFIGFFRSICSIR